MTLFIRFLILLLLFGFGFQSNFSYAQNSKDDIVPLDEMLNPDMVKPKNNKKAPVTAADHANAYFEKCNSEDHVVLTPSEQEVICACSAANMTGVLTVREFKALNAKSEDGDIARQKALLYAYAPCISHVVPEYARKDCFRSDTLAQIRVGREKICACAGGRVENTVALSAVDLIERFNMYQPEELDFLKFYFMDPTYEFTLKQAIAQCAYEYNYARGH